MVKLSFIYDEAVLETEISFHLNEVVSFFYHQCGLIITRALQTHVLFFKWALYSYFYGRSEFQKQSRIFPMGTTSRPLLETVVWRPYGFSCTTFSPYTTAS